MSKDTKRLIAWVVLVLVFAAGTFFGYREIHKVDDLTHKVAGLSLANHGLVTSLQSAIVESCEENGNSRAEVQRETLQEELQEAKHPDPEAFKALVEAGVPAATINALEAKQIGKLKIRLGRVHIANCQSQYRISPGSGARRRARP
jgi:glutamate dehydrogenase/leucine dehydrogenase